MYYIPPHFYPINVQDSSNKYVVICTVEKCVDPDQLASQKRADLDLHFFQTGPIWVKFSKYPTHLYPRANESDKAVFSCLLTKTCFNKIISTKLDDYLINEISRELHFQ